MAVGDKKSVKKVNANTKSNQESFTAFATATQGIGDYAEKMQSTFPLGKLGARLLARLARKQ